MWCVSGDLVPVDEKKKLDIGVVRRALFFILVLVWQ